MTLGNSSKYLLFIDLLWFTEESESFEAPWGCIIMTGQNGHFQSKWVDNYVRGLTFLTLFCSLRWRNTSGQRWKLWEQKNRLDPLIDLFLWGWIGLLKCFTSFIIWSIEHNGVCTVLIAQSNSIKHTRSFQFNNRNGGN